MANVKVFGLDPLSEGHSGVKVKRNISHSKGLVPRGVVSKYEVNPFTNKEVMTNVKQDFNKEVIV